MNKLIRTSLGLAACAAIGTAAYAAIFFVNEDTLFVGKGDVQTACGLNNSGAQLLLAAAVDASWKVDLAVDYSIVCSFTTGEGTRGEQTHNVSLPKKVKDVTVSYDARKVNQINGIFLTLEAASGGVPVVGGSCLGYGVDGEITSVTLVDEDSGTGAVYIDCTVGGTNPQTLVGVPAV
jgi:hypothetical protein